MIFRFASPLWLIALIIPAFVVYRYIRSKGTVDAAIVFSDVSVFRTVGSGFGRTKRILSLLLATLSVMFVVFAMARPQSGRSFQSRSTYGIDIILAMDVSTSMAAMDFNPLTRYEASVEVVKEFIGRRTTDRMGLVAFAAQSFTLCPLTLDYDLLSAFVDKAWDARIDDGTAIGSAIATSINRLRDSEAKSKIIILLTDGMNNYGSIDPVTAANLAKTHDIKIYTVGVGSEGSAPIIANGRTMMTETHIDEEKLRKVADITGGKYYRAKNRGQLSQIYDEINQLETTEINYHEWIEYNELYRKFLAAGLFLSVIAFIADRSLLKRLP